MERTTTIPYRLISLFFLLIVILINWGFYRTYLVLFPDFKGFNALHHFHGVVTMGWMFMLIVQPLLIRYGKTGIHSLIGRLSFILAPLVVVSIFLTARLGYFRPEPQATAADKIAGLALPIPGLLAFATFYVLAIINRRNTYNHLRYMIGTALIMIGPGLGRVLIMYFNVPFFTSVTSILIIEASLALCLLLLDIYKGRSFRAFLVVTLVCIAALLSWEFRLETAWQIIGGFFAGMF